MALPFADGSGSPVAFEGMWTVQAFQHVPGFSQACRESHRVLRRGDRFVNYSLHAPLLHRAIYWVCRKPYHLTGMLAGRFFLDRASEAHRREVESVFGRMYDNRYTECLFHPDLRVRWTGRIGSRVGELDARLGDLPWLGRWIARQRSFEAVKD